MKTRHQLIVTALITLLPGNMAFSQPAEYNLTTTVQLQDAAYGQQIEDFYENGIEGRFDGQDEVKIYYKIFRQQKDEYGAILLSPGRTEAVLKYREVAYDLFSNGYSVYLIDHRGQGLSGRMTNDPEMGYVDDFRYYVDDMKTFYDRFMAPGGHDKTYLLAHSLGGAIGMRYLQLHPDDFTAAAFSSPMLGLSAYICPLARILSGKTPKYAPGQNGYDEDSTSFTENSVTGCEIRFHRMIAGYEKVPGARLGGASVQWLDQSCKGMKRIFKDVGQLKTPFILFTAENETVVNPKAYDKFIRKVEKAGKIYRHMQIPDAQHELLMEKDPQRSATLTNTLQFFRSY
jgi:lysophospholipase